MGQQTDWIHFRLSVKVSKILIFVYIVCSGGVPYVLTHSILCLYSLAFIIFSSLSFTLQGLIGMVLETGR